MSEGRALQVEEIVPRLWDAGKVLILAERKEAIVPSESELGRGWQEIRSER